jgi:hypothetical protein
VYVSFSLDDFVDPRPAEQSRRQSQSQSQQSQFRTRSRPCTGLSNFAKMGARFEADHRVNAARRKLEIETGVRTYLPDNELDDDVYAAPVHYSPPASMPAAGTSFRPAASLRQHTERPAAPPQDQEQDVPAASRGAQILARVGAILTNVLQPLLPEDTYPFAEERGVVRRR